MSQTSPSPLLSVSRCAALLLLLLTSHAAAQSPAQQTVAQVVDARRSVELFIASQNSWTPPQVGKLLAPGDGVRTGDDGWAALLLADETLMQINRRSRLMLKQVAQSAGWLERTANGAVSGRSNYELTQGEMWLRNKNLGSQIEIQTPTVSAGIRGTELHLEVADDGVVYIRVLEGQVEASNQFGTVYASANEEVVTAPGSAPQKRVLLNPENAVQWTIAIPALVTASGKSAASSQTVRASYQKLVEGDLGAAQAGLTAAVAQDPQNADAKSFLSMAKLMGGDSASAQTLAQTAAVQDSQNPLAWLSLSYALQANFDLPAALEAAQTALALNPNDILARVNTATILFGMERLDEAWSVLQEGSAAGAGSAEYQSTLGFLELARRHAASAASAFRRAVVLDPGFGEPHLGLGLLAMRQDDLTAATEEISKAVLLDPRRSLFVSYWGKFLYQKRRFERALQLMELAAELDPKDPTPNLYRAVILRDLNRPTEAITTLQAAIAQNDNRAVYRGRFLLDRDLATKNINLSLLYDQIGLSAWARSKAVDSIKGDYTNSSAHLFLAGALNASEGRGQAAAAETTLAQLLQTANLNSFNTFNDYTSFFETPDYGGSASAAYGSFKSRGANTAVYGAIPEYNLAMSGAYFYNDTDGWRGTNYERSSDVITNVKWDVTPDDSLLASASFPDTRNGGNTTNPFVYSDDPEADAQFRLEGEKYLIGYRKRLGDRSVLLAYYRHQSQDGAIATPFRMQTMFEDGSPASLFSIDRRTISLPTRSGGAQLYHRAGKHELIGGTYQLDGSSSSAGESSTFVDFGSELVPLDSQPILSEGDDRAENYYLSDTWTVLPWLTLEGAIYYDRLTRTQPITQQPATEREWSPRAAVIVRPADSETFRFAAFQYVVPIFDQRIDPTNIGGLTVYRGGYEGSTTRELSTAWEHEWASGFSSLSFFTSNSSSDLYSFDDEDPSAVVSDEQTIESRGVEWTLNQLLWPGAGLALGYRFKNSERILESTPLGDDHLAVAALRYLRPSGVFMSAAQTYRSTHFRSQSRSPEDLWLTDLGVGYELPRKIGRLQLDAFNVFDSHFDWYIDDFVFVGRVPERALVASFTYTFDRYR